MIELKFFETFRAFVRKMKTKILNKSDYLNGKICNSFINFNNSIFANRKSFIFFYYAFYFLKLMIFNSNENYLKNLLLRG